MPVDRYHRQTLLPEFGREGQARLARSCVAVVGVGALGSASSEMLARAGVGHLILIDRDIVEPTNLQRQTLYTEADANAGVAKARAARGRAHHQRRAREGAEAEHVAANRRSFPSIPGLITFTAL